MHYLPRREVPMDAMMFVNSVRHETEQAVTVFRLVLDTAAGDIKQMASQYGFDADRLLATFIQYIQADGIGGIATALEQDQKPDEGDEWKRSTEE